MQKGKTGKKSKIILDTALYLRYNIKSLMMMGDFAPFLRKSLCFCVKTALFSAYC